MKDLKKNNIMEKPLVYEAPSIEVVEVMVEKGFESSAAGGENPGRAPGEEPTW